MPYRRTYARTPATRRKRTKSTTSRKRTRTKSMGAKAKSVRRRLNFSRTGTTSRVKTASSTVNVVRTTKSRRRARQSMVNLFGACSMRDEGSTIQDANTVYLGHATFSPTEALVAMARAITRRLLLKAGISIESFEQQLPAVEDLAVGSTIQAYGFRYQLFLPNDGSNIFLQTQIVRPSDTPTAEELARALIEDGTTGLRATMLDQAAQLRYVQLVNIQGSTNEVTRVASQINLHHCTFHFECRSELKIQNRTVAAETDGTTADLIEDVGNNPLYGFYVTGTGSGLKDKAFTRRSNATDQTIERDGFFTDNANPTIIAGAGITGDTHVRYPQDGANFLNSTSSKKVYIKPGDIKISSLYHKFSISFVALINLIRPQLGEGRDSTQKVFYRKGKCALYSFRRVLDSKSTTGNGDPNPKVAWEALYKIGCWMSEKTTQYIPDMMVTDL